MASKRLRESAEQAQDQPEGKRMRPLPSFRMVLKDAVVAKSLQSLFLVLEPLFRRVVREEIEHILDSNGRLHRSPQMLIQESRTSPALRLLFKSPPSLPIFTENRIEDDDGNSLEILLVDIYTGRRPQAPLPSSIKVELVVIKGDFPCEDREDWSTADFNRAIVEERRGRKPLLTGDTLLTLKDGAACIDDLKFTDNSSWIRSRNFRIGARLQPESQLGLSIREAVTNRFIVKDQRGESYKKHYPPALVDQVWRLEKIGRDGTFHKRLEAEGINTVQDFLKLSVVDASRLRKVLKMSDKTWEATINHARTCTLGDKMYLLHTPLCTILLSPICEVVRVEMDGISCTFKELSGTVRAKVQESVQEAYTCWHSLEEIRAPVQGESMNHALIEPAYQIGGFVEVGFIQSDLQKGLSGWSPLMHDICLE
ncbi:hypothetical protein HPP92_009594 [Vanilla planifolia]|uniref:Uncharacterized protein n=1 Tax=Vanilla planifolia TaxID=51239 RepID=A0A835REK3_VANPL|nr:hypothetical protein HPP92_009594 [Vanilla planifolia]